jgi:hypothetical protein
MRWTSLIGRLYIMHVKWSSPTLGSNAWGALGPGGDGQRTSRCMVARRSPCAALQLPPARPQSTLRCPRRGRGAPWCTSWTNASRYEVIGSCNRGRWAAHSSPAFAHEGLAAGHMSVWRRPRAWESRGACSPPALMSCSAPRRRLGRRRRRSRPSSRTPGRSSTLLTAQASRPSRCGRAGG